MRVFVCALILVGAAALVWHLRPHAASSARTGRAVRVELPPASSPIRLGEQAEPSRPAARPTASAPPDAYYGVVVAGATGKPIAEAQVMLCHGLRNGTTPCAESIATAETDDVGRFYLQRPLDAVGALVVEAEDFAAAVVREPAAYSRIELWPPALVTGRVTNAAREPVPDAVVGWVLPGAELRDLPDNRVAVEEDASFELEALPAGEVVLYAMGRDGRTCTLHAVLRSGENREVELVLEDAQTLLVRGVVQDRGGRALAFVRITLDDRIGTGALDADVLLAAARDEDLVTGADGRFELRFRAAGPHQLSFWSSTGADAELLAQATVLAGPDPQPIVIPVWDPNIVVCHLEGEDGRPAPFTDYSYSASRRIHDPDEPPMFMGEMGATSGAHAEVAFVWPGRIELLEVSLGNDSIDGTARLRDPRDPCVAQVSTDE
jgi:hypothetical protein